MTTSRAATVALSTVVIGLGLALVVRTILAGVGGGLGLLLGGVFVLVGAVRLVVVLR